METSDGALAEARKASQSRWFERAARFGWAANGLLHLVLGVLALHVAFSGDGEADQGGALDTLSSQPLGAALLWICFPASLLLGLWSLSQAVFTRGRGLGYRARESGIGVVFLAIAAAFGLYAFGGSMDSSQEASSASAALMSHPAGNVLLVLVGLAFIGTGGFFVFKGLFRRFRKDLATPSRRQVRRILRTVGAIGYTAKGLALAALGLLLVVATAQQDPEDASGLDGALKAVRDQALGIPALALIGAGLSAYGVYLFFRARYDTMD